LRGELSENRQCLSFEGILFGEFESKVTSNTPHNPKSSGTSKKKLLLHLNLLNMFSDPNISVIPHQREVLNIILRKRKLA